MFSIEFEVCAERSLHRALVLLMYGYLRTYDPTVSDEYKSPRYSSLAAFQLVLPVCDQLRDLVTERCGTHIHVDCPEHIKAKVHQWQDVLFGPLEDYMADQVLQTRQFWGRSYRGGVVNPYTRYQTIEFRMPRFRHALQYLAVVKFCRHAGQLLTQSFDKEPTTISPSVPPMKVAEALLALYQEAVQEYEVGQSQMHASALTSPSAAAVSL